MSTNNSKGNNNKNRQADENPRGNLNATEFSLPRQSAGIERLPAALQHTPRQRLSRSTFVNSNVYGRGFGSPNTDYQRQASYNNYNSTAARTPLPRSRRGFDGYCYKSSPLLYRGLQASSRFRPPPPNLPSPRCYLHLVAFSQSQSYPPEPVGEVVKSLRSGLGNGTITHNNGDITVTREWATRMVGLGHCERSTTSRRMILKRDSELIRVGGNLGIPTLFLQWFAEDDGLGGDQLKMPKVVASSFWTA